MRGMRGCVATLLVSLATLLPLPWGAAAAEARSGGAQRDQDLEKLPSFFNLGQNPFQWDDDALFAGFGSLDSKKVTRGRKVDREAFARAGNLASHLELTPIEAIHVNVPVNLFLIGFDGDGNRAVKLEEAEIQRWFEHMDFEVPHTRVPVDGYPADGADAGPALPTVSAVQYNFSAHVVETGDKAAEVVEHALRLYKRPLDPLLKDRSGQVQQVEVGQMNALIESLLKEMGLDTSAYNLIILNPKVAEGAPVYGYRTGFSDEEMKHLATHPEEVPSVGGSPGSATHAERTLGGMLKDSGWQHKRTHEKFYWNRYLSPEATDWAGKVQSMLESLEATRGVMLSAADGPLKVLREDAASLMNGGDEEAARYVKTIVQREAAGVHESCLTDTWVGQGRYAWVDLSAGPFQWGPLVGGMGVREPHSLPSVQKAFGHLPEGTGVTGDLEEVLEAMADAAFDGLGDEDEQDTVELLTAELDVYEMFALVHCQDRQRHIPLCEELRDWVKTLEDKLDAEIEDRSERTGKGKQDLLDLLVPKEKQKREHGWNIFGNDEHAANFSMSRDLFLSELGSTITSALHMAFTPSLAAASFHHHHKLSFLLYVVSDHDSYKPTAPTAFDVEALRTQLQRLCLPHQKFQMAVHRMQMGDDPALSLAYANAMRSAVVPSVAGPGGNFQARMRRYLDSTTLQHQLLQVNRNRVRHKRGEKYTTAAGGTPDAVLEVPIFLLSVDEDTPLFIDKHYLAKSLPDMVLVVQNREETWDSHLACNNRTIQWNLRNPLKQTLAAVAQHVGGVLPSHVTYSLPRRATAQSWLWASGNHPLSPTGSGTAFSQLNLDAVHRSYVITSLDHSVLSVNEAIAVLANETTSEDSYDVFRHLAPQLQALQAEFVKLERLWDSTVAFVRELKFDEAMQDLATIEDHSHKFRELARELSGAMHPALCTRQRGLRIGWLQLTGCAIALVGLALFHVLRPRSFKPKIN